MSEDRGAHDDLPLVGAGRQRLLLVDGDLGRRATFAVALGTRYVVHTPGRIEEAQRCAAGAPFAAAVLDSAVLQGALPALVRLLRKRSPTIRLLVAAGCRDLRGSHYAASLGVDGRLGPRTQAATMFDRLRVLIPGEEKSPPFDRTVGRAIDLIARDVTHLLDLNALSEATGVSLTLLAGRFRAATGVGLHAYVARVRVTVAQHLLRDTCLSVATLAELLGFENADELARATGLTAQRL